MKRLFLVLTIFLSALLALSQEKTAVIRPGDNLVLENIPAVPVSIAEKANQYGEFRAAGLYSWHPLRRELLMGTRFSDVQQVHLLKMPGGARTQLTFFPDRVLSASWGPR
ncbi:MAG TPA: hypothetical protein VNW97_18380, partial [Candidatus Saccharimonadales bacterium]|nr:hypothetical protein [Candidatus Saccharimonadales bacterium]